MHAATKKPRRLVRVPDAMSSEGRGKSPPSPHVAPAEQRVRTSARKVYLRGAHSSNICAAQNVSKRVSNAPKWPQVEGLVELEASQIVVLRHGNRQRRQSTQDEVVPVRRVGIDELECPGAGGQGVEDDLSFEPRQRRAEAVVHAVAEGDVVRVASGEVERVGVIHKPRVAVRRGESAHHALTLGELDPVDLEVAAGAADRHLDRAVEAEQFVGAGHRQGWVSSQRRELIGVA